MISSATHDKVWWRCPICHQPYKASPAHRTSKDPEGCPVCAGKKIVAGINDLESRYPEIAAEWHQDLNNQLPPQVAPNYSKKVWWKCKICGKEFYMSPNVRVNRNRGCKECSRIKTAQRVHDNALLRGVNDLESQYPNLVKEWDYAKNEGILPSETNVNSNTKVHWICSRCENTWEASPYSRTKLNSGCSKCGYKKMIQSRRLRIIAQKGSLADNFPEIAAEWHPTKNGDIKPEMITSKSNYHAYWKCKMDDTHVWQAYVYSRTQKGSGCPYCRKKRRTT